MEKNLIKKIMTALLAAVFALAGLSACNIEPESGPGVINVIIQNAGFGYGWLEAAAAKYTEETNIKVNVKAVTVEGQALTHSLNQRRNNTDLYFTITGPQSFFENMNQGPAVIPGYDFLYTDLSDVYDAKADGYEGDLTIRDLSTEFGRSNATWNGKEYGFSWAHGNQGMVYNIDMFAQHGLSLPQTTDGLLRLCEDIKEKNLKTAGNKSIYAMQWTQEYLGFWEYELWFQYEGRKNYDNYIQGKDASGIYSAEIYRQRGRFTALETIESFIGDGRGFSNPGCAGYSFTQNQLKFLEGEAFMMYNGNWLEREAAGNFPDDRPNISFMKMPVNSKIIEKTPSIDNDGELAEVVAWVDGGKTAQLSKTYDEADLMLVQDARNVSWSHSNAHIGFIPSYSKNIGEAKDFIRFLYAKPTQELIMKSAFGHNFSIAYDFSGMADYAEFSSLKKSLDNILMNPDVFFVGQESRYPMFYLGGLGHPTAGLNGLSFPTSSASYKRPLSYVSDDYNFYNATFQQRMTQAGVRN
jgi:ABC-type glycerol-3-phosphate transport system substrate-binding protein